MTPNRDNSDLLLTAFRYVSGELPAGEAAEFESALSQDQSARDALVDVVELSEAVAVEEFDRIQSKQHDSVALRSRFATRGWATVAVLCIVVVTCFTVFNNGNQQDIAEPGAVVEQPEDMPVQGDANSVLSLWSDLGWDNADLFESDAFLAHDTEALAPDGGEIPDWLLTAVVGDEVETGTDNMPDDMRELMDDLDPENL